MTSKFTELIIDSKDPRKLAAFWHAVLDYHVTADDGTVVEIAAWERAEEGSRPGPIPPTLVFVPVSEGKTVKNRLHIDVNPADCTQEEEVQRLLALGATHVDVGQGEGQSWVVLADPERNEFCVLRNTRP